MRQEQQRDSREGERKLGDPGFIQISVEDITYDKRRESSHPKGYGGSDEDLPEPEHRRLFTALAKWHNTHYAPDTLGGYIRAGSLEELAQKIREGQEKTGVRDQRKYTYSFECKSHQRYVCEGEKGGRSHEHALSPEDQQRLLTLLRGGHAEQSGGAFGRIGQRIDRVVGSVQEGLRRWFNE